MKTNEKGITLAALVVTIVVMTIIAGITLGSNISKTDVTNLEKNRAEDYLTKSDEQARDLETLTKRVND